ncbi:MAG TPA: DUF4390 domain-containing protein [Burkholderiaceae bacterium]|nr:DUF4390 domain-containing protein [Burkholderiaceae bacterium]
MHPPLVRTPHRWNRLAQDARRVVASALLAVACLAGLALPAAPARAQGVELPSIVAKRQDGAVMLDFVANLTLSRAVEEALRRGVPVYFVAEATVKKPRWYWRDERVSRVARSWRLSYQPLTSAWRVSLGAFSQSYPSLEEALTTVTRIAHWRVADSGVDATDRYYVDFQFYLDASQLPPPMKLDLNAQSEWKLGVERTLPVE